MPGTVHVTVVELKGVSSSSKPSARSVRVSMGKRQYQTWDRGNFSFPITRIKENLVVALLDAGGNEIAHQDIRIMQIIEKGSWDEVFSINGGGHVHMKLHFTLSEEDRNRIRVMRESAMKKKLETNPNVKLLLPEAVTSSPTSDSVQTSIKVEERISASAKGSVNIDHVTSPKVEASRAGSSPASAPSSPPTHQIDTAIPDATEIEAKPPKFPISSISDKINSVASEKPRKQGSVDKTASSVRKMISAFESSQLQDVKSMKRAASVPSQLNRLRKEGLMEDRPTESVDKTSTDFKENSDQLPTTDGKVVTPTRSERTDTFADEVSRASSEIPKEGEKTTVDLVRQLASETATSSGRLTEERSPVAQGSGRGRGRGTGLTSSTMADTPKPKTLHHYEEGYSSDQSSGMWIFPDNTRRFCVTTAGMERVGHQNAAKTHQARNISLETHKNQVHDKMENNLKKNHQQLESGSGSSPKDSSNGVIGQVIKIAVIVGFGVLVLLTRQKEPRKKTERRKIPDYVDDTTMKPWGG